MARRKAYSKVNKIGQIRANHVKGQGDVVWKGFQCLNPECREFIYVKENEIGDDFLIPCPKCGFEFFSGGHTKFYDYSMDVTEDDGSVHSVSKGSFTVSHDEYLDEAERYKYCIVCNTLKPLRFFDKHSARTSGRQGECQLCKKTYNAIKNGTRLTDQHREAAQKRRLLIDISGNPKIDSRAIERRYRCRCFNCGMDLSNVASAKEKPMDHTLPVYYLWPLTTETATLLCRECNGNKSGTWPSEFYNDRQLRELSVITGLDYELLAGPPQYNPDALDSLRDPDKVDMLLVKFSAYMDELIKLRNRILRDTGLDFFRYSRTISDDWIRRADDLL